MGQKTHPIGFRLGVNKTWNSRWYSNKEYSKFLHEDLKAREFLKKKLRHAGVSRIEIERVANKTKVNIHTARPGIVIGKKGTGIDQLKAQVKKYLKSSPEVFINIMEVRKAEADAQLIAENVADQLQRRVAFRRAMKKAMSQAFKFGVKGIKVQCRGRLGGSDIARTERYAEGSVPLHTLRADVDYGFSEAYTTYGQIGIKVWVYKGEIIGRRAIGGISSQQAPGSETGAAG
ncbi:MAG: 30S ribosomal protein S3 [Bdellovibrionaceae bacterium]|nr:30S ribosomal protein S3 [Bdellovibrionales bacterium]MCB9253965.1 30S ribosomal protein S3 [Pseudobdellovibrionaceae bacterium]